jgi:hypothetical protein
MWMETTPTCEPDASGTTKRRRERKPPKLPKYVLPNRDNLDGRTHAAKAFEKLYGDIHADLGNDLTAVERALVEGFCGATIVLQALNTKLALGEAVDLTEHASVCSSMVRIAAKIGLSRRSRIVSGLIEAEVEPSRSPLRDRMARTAAEINRESGLNTIEESA